MILVWVSGLVMLVAIVSVAVSLYNTMASRRRELALLRALGAPRSRLLWLVVVEAAVLCLIGSVCGVVIGHAVLTLAAPWVEASAGVRLETGLMLPTEAYFVLAVVGAGSLAGLLPALRAYRVDVARGL